MPMLFAALELTSPLYGQSEAAPKIEQLNTTVTVTGTRTATELDRSPVSTSLVTREEMETRNVSQVDQVLSLIEGVNAFHTKGPNDSDFNIGLRGFAGRGSPARTLILLDGQPLNDSYYGSVNWTMLPVGEFERVEVARGPFSSLYGGNAMGGVINLITRRVDHRQFEVFGQYGSWDTTNYSAHYSDRFFGRLGVSLGYQRYQSGGYEEQAVLKTAASGAGAVPVTGVVTLPTSTGGVNYQVGMTGREWFNQHAYRARLEYTFSPQTFASLQFFHQSRGGGFDAYDTYLRNAAGMPVDSGLVSFVDPGGVARVLSVTPANYLSSPTGASTYTWQAQVLHTFSPHWNLRVLAGYNWAPQWWYITPAANATLTTGGGSYTPQTTRSHYGNLQAGFTPHGRHQFIFGTETRHDAAGIQVVTVPSYTSRQNGNPITSQASGQAINQAAYVQDQIGIGERLHLVAGARYDYWSTYDGLNQTTATIPPAHYPNRGSHSVTAKLAASYTLAGGFQLRASVGNAFRQPTIYELYRNAVIGSNLYAANPDALPERLLSYDVGVQRHFGSRATLDAGYFENRVHDMLYRTTDLAADPAGHLMRLTNAALGRIRGTEIAANERIRAWLQLKQTYTYTDGVITDNPSLPATVGKRLPQVPAHMTSFIALLNRNRWLGSVSGRYQSSVFSSDTNTDVVRGVPGSYSPFFTADASAGYRMTGNITITANATNILDRRYYLYYLAAGRQVFIGLRIRL